ncbi:glycosyltransferase family 39 protein [bacterium]|nr:glycosyltransferase family 39 protein [bacterium]
MKIFSTILALAGVFCLLSSLLLLILPFDVNTLQNVLTSDGSFDSLIQYAASGLTGGFALAGCILLLLALLLYLLAVNKLKIHRLSSIQILSIVIAFQFIAGLIYVINITYIPHEDYQWYHLQATHLSEGAAITDLFGSPTAYWPIGYPLFLSVFYKLFGAEIGTAQIVGVVIAIFSSVVALLLYRKFLPKDAAFKSLIVFALIPSGIFYASLPQSDSFFGLLISLIALLSLGSASWFNTIILGIVFGYAALTRPVILFFPLFIAAYRYLRDKNLRQALIHLIIIFVLGELILLPWQIRNYQIFDDFVLSSTNGGKQVWMGNNHHASGGYLPDRSFMSYDEYEQYHALSETKRDSYAFEKGVSWIIENPTKLVLLWPKKFMHLYYKDSKCITYTLHEGYESYPPFIIMGLIISTEGFYYSLGLVFILALIRLFRQRLFDLNLWIVLALIVYFTAVYLPFVADGRYHLPLMPFFVLFIFAAFSDSREKSRQL